VSLKYRHVIDDTPLDGYATCLCHARHAADITPLRHATASMPPSATCTSHATIRYRHTLDTSYAIASHVIYARVPCKCAPQPSHQLLEHYYLVWDFKKASVIVFVSYVTIILLRHIATLIDTDATITIIVYIGFILHIVYLRSSDIDTSLIAAATPCLLFRIEERAQRALPHFRHGRAIID